MKKTLTFIVTMSLILLTLSSCQQNIGILNQTTVELYQGETFQLELIGSKTNKNLPWVSDNEAYITVSPKGLITAKYVGEAIISVEDQACKVKVIPRITEFSEPYFKPYATKKEILSNMGPPEFPDDPSENNIVYYDYDIYDQITYSLNNKGELTHLPIIIYSIENANIIIELYKEKYKLQEKSIVDNDERYFFTNTDAKYLKDIKYSIYIYIKKDEIIIEYDC